MSGSYREVEDYARREVFDFYRRYRCPFYDLTFELEISRLEALARERQESLYLTLCYFFATAMARVEDFRIRFLDGKIVLYDRLDVGLTVPAPDGCFSFAYVPYESDLAAFYARGRAAMDSASQQVSLQQIGWPNTIFFTALPNVPFTSFHHAPADDPTAGEPKVAFGRYRRSSNELLIPVSVQVNHAFIDGRALGELVEEAQALFDRPTGERA